MRDPLKQKPQTNHLKVCLQGANGTIVSETKVVPPHPTDCSQYVHIGVCLFLSARTDAYALLINDAHVPPTAGWHKRDSNIPKPKDTCF